MGVLLGFVALAVLAVVFAVGVLRMVQQGETIVIERLGRYHKTLDSGINLIIPFVDRPREILWRHVGESRDGGTIYRKSATARIDLREQIYDFPRQNVITKDNVSTEINAMIYFQIVDPMKAVYEIADLPNAIEKLTQTNLRNLAGEMELDALLSSREKVNTSLRQILDDATDKWGVKINRVEIQDIIPPADIRDAMEKQMRAERDKRASILTAEGAKQAAILEAEGLRESSVTRAEGEKKAAVLGAEGVAESRLRVAEAEAQAIRMIAQALGNTGANPAAYLLTERYIQAVQHMADTNAEKVVFMPFEAAGLMSSLGSVKELFASSQSGVSRAVAQAAEAPSGARKVLVPTVLVPDDGEVEG